MVQQNIVKRSNFPRKLKIGNKIKTGEDEIANEFNKCFADISPSLAKSIPDPAMPFESFLKRVNTTLPSQSLSINELKDAFFFLKTNKSSGADEINFNVIKHCFGELCGPLKYLFDPSLQIGVFPHLLKIALVLPAFKTGDTADISNYRPISVLPCFSKILERVMYNRLYKYLRLTNNKNRFYHSKELFESCEILNVYKMNLFNTAVFMHKIKNRTVLSSFLEKFEQPSHSYSTHFSSGNYRKAQIKLRKCRF